MRIPTGSGRLCGLSTRTAPYEDCTRLRSPIRAPSWADTTGKDGVEPACAISHRRPKCGFPLGPAGISRRMHSNRVSPLAPGVPMRVFLSIHRGRVSAPDDCSGNEPHWRAGIPSPRPWLGRFDLLHARDALCQQRPFSSSTRPYHVAAALSRRAVVMNLHHLRRYAKLSETPRARGGEEP